MKDRSVRRHSKERMKKKAKNLVTKIWNDSYYKENPDKAEEFAQSHADNLAKCSCWMCANPRRIFKEKTIQEKKEDERINSFDE